MQNLDYELMFKIILGVCGILFGTIIPLVISLVNAIQKRKQAKKQAVEAQSETERAEAEAKAAEAEADLLQTATLLIDSAETLYKEIDKTLKKECKGSAGAVKKDSVMTKLRSYAIEKDYYFDAEKWSAAIDNIVKITKNVNGCDTVKIGG